MTLMSIEMTSWSICWGELWWCLGVRYGQIVEVVTLGHIMGGHWALGSSLSPGQQRD